MPLPSLEPCKSKDNASSICCCFSHNIYFIKYNELHCHYETLVHTVTYLQLQNAFPSITYSHRTSFLIVNNVILIQYKDILINKNSIMCITNYSFRFQQLYYPLYNIFTENRMSFVLTHIHTEHHSYSK
eukprot:216779_1